eukprot:436086-Alexandrium_andersonii.AAC.1
MTSTGAPVVLARWCCCHLRPWSLDCRCWRASSGSQRRASLEAGPSGAVPGADPTGLPLVRATRRKSSASSFLSADSWAQALLERG